MLPDMSYGCLGRAGSRVPSCGPAEPLDSNRDLVVKHMIRHAAAIGTDVKILINNAGIATFEGLISARDGSPARSEMETNYFGALNMIRSFAPVLADNGEAEVYPDSVAIDMHAGLLNDPKAVEKQVGEMLPV